MGFHKGMSYVKSCIRIFGYIALLLGIESISAFVVGCGLLILAEIFGIFEEVKEDN